eukprot:7651422-Pyramimonas_sp.AAC.1
MALTTQETSSSIGHSGSWVAILVINRLNNWTRHSTLPISQCAAPGAIHISTPLSDAHLAAPCEQWQPSAPIRSRAGRR